MCFIRVNLNRTILNLLDKLIELHYKLADLFYTFYTEVNIPLNDVSSYEKWL